VLAGFGLRGEDASDFDGEVIGLLFTVVRRPDVAQAGEELSRWERVILFKVVDGRHDDAGFSVSFQTLSFK
jgi:hypothetical protein